jgi:DNA topoisomerase I
MEEPKNRETEINEEEELESVLPSTNPAEAARAAGLYYVMEGEPGYTRKRQGRGFIYLDSSGKRVTNPRLIERFKALVIPPAWAEVWICRRPNGHIHVTGRDARGRKQYRYHLDWSAIRSQTKFSRMALFGQHLPTIRARVAADLRRPRLSHEKVTALVVRLLEQTLIRVGNQEYARHNQSYGLTTLLDDHIKVEGSRVILEFTGKRGKPFEIEMRSRQMSRLVKRCQDLPGQQLFQYLDEDGICCQALTSGDVNDYLRETTSEDFSAKDFRTWGGTLLAAMELYQRGPAHSEKHASRQIVQVVKDVASALNNTPTICRQYYIHPAVLHAYRDGSLFTVMTHAMQAAPPHQDPDPDSPDLSAEEQAVLELLQWHAKAAQ